MATLLTREVTRRSPVDRALSLFAAVNPGEGWLALLLTLDVFIVLGAYYVLKVVREPLILTGGAFGLKGAQLKVAAAGAQAFLLLFAVPLYGKVAQRQLGARLLNTVTAFFIACLAGFYLLDRAAVPIGLAFFIWLGIFNMMAVAQLWALAADVYSKEQGERLFAIVAFGGTSGAVAGSAGGGWLIARLAPGEIMLVAAGLLAASMMLTAHIATVAKPRPPAARSRSGGFGLVVRRPYLLLIALLVLVYNTVNTNGEYIMGATVVQHAVERFPADAAAQRHFIGSFYGGFFTIQNVLTAFLQLFVVGRVMQKAGVRVALLILPIISLMSSSMFALLPVLAIVRIAKVLENSTDYSLHNTARQALFLPTAPDEKYKAKAAIDTFFARFGDVASMGLVALTAALGFGIRAVAVVNLVLVCVWALLALGVGRRYQKETA